MPYDPIAAVEFETMVFTRHNSDLTGRPRRSSGILNHSAYLLLNVLQTAGPQTIAELSEITRLTVSTLTRQTASLTAAGYAEHILDPSGTPARKLRITTTGLEALAEERAITRSLMREIMSEWSAEECEAFAAMLRKLNNDIEKRSGSPWPRPSDEMVRAAKAAAGE